MFEWIKSWFIKKSDKKDSDNRITIDFILPDGKKFGIECFKLGCKEHPEYSGKFAPTNNCNDCWEFYSKNRHRW